MNVQLFKTVNGYIKELGSGYFRALSSFYVYEALKEAKAINVFGKSKAEENVAVLNKFRNFFTPTEEALRVYFFIELAKLFDISNQSLHVNKVVNLTESNIKHLTVDAFEEYNSKQPRPFLEQLVKEYKGVDHKDLTELRDLIDTHSNSLEKLKIYRDKWLAHNDLNKPELPVITGDEIQSLFTILEKILNSLDSKLNNSSSEWDHIERDAKMHTNLVIDHLHRFEPYRLKEINEKQNQEIEKRSQ